jgi:hypothetical protein
MDFKTATDELMAKGVSLPEIAEAFGAAYTTVRAWRLDPSSASYRRPPEDWAPRLAQLARERGGEFVALSRNLERAAGEGE